jgi:hypothetical protein
MSVMKLTFDIEKLKKYRQNLPNWNVEINEWR